ncbi:CD109 antigen-like [Physella acuta]|uniref:CD109 antigen-like n=1 Tax=Physella acuta TaxID=109671 RepID=UPI0027DBE654|nr:CD109 antigen-like [Physella acuta]
MRLFLFLIVAITAVCAQNSSTYLILAPSTIHPNMDFTVSVNILKATGYVTVTAQVLRETTVVASGADVFKEGNPGTITIKGLCGQYMLRSDENCLFSFLIFYPRPPSASQIKFSYEAREREQHNSSSIDALKIKKGYLSLEEPLNIPVSNVQLPPDLTESKYYIKVVGSGGLVFDNSKSLSYNSKKASLFIQLNKAIFKPSDTVKFRIFGVNSNLQSYKGAMNISIYDAQYNKIKQWVKFTPVKGVIAQELTLSSQPVLGDWTVVVETGDSEKDKSFTVAEYVLPLFEVEVIMPPYVLISDSDVTFTVKANNFFKTIIATVQTISYNFNCKQLPQKKEIDGETRVLVPMSKVTEKDNRLNRLSLLVNANVTESLTGNQMAGSGTVTMYEYGVILEYLENNSKTFKPGLQYNAYLQISEPDGRPISSANESVTVNIQVYNYSWSYFRSSGEPIDNQTLNIPINLGFVPILVEIPPDAEMVIITSHFRGATETKHLKKSHSPSSSYLQISMRSSSLKAGDTIVFSINGTEELSKLVYQVLSRGCIEKSGTINGNNQKSVNFSIVSEPSMAPSARMVVYYVRPDGEVVADSISFDVIGAFKNKVTVDLDKTDVEPGDDVTVVTTADPDSNVHLLAIDQSVLLLKSGNDVTANDIHSDLMEYASQGYPKYYVHNDARKILENAGLVVLTDAVLPESNVLSSQFSVLSSQFSVLSSQFSVLSSQFSVLSSQFSVLSSQFSVLSSQFSVLSSQFSVLSSQFSVLTYVAHPGEPQGPYYQTAGKAVKFQEPVRVRQIFPESWLWTDVYVGSMGSASITTTVPDTITSWVVSAFAINSKSGLGMAPTHSYLKVFRPFFVSLNLPYSVTRGEHLALQANVFNYQPDDMQVRVTLAESKRFHNIFIDETGNQEQKQVDVVHEVMVKAGEAESVYFPIVPDDLGRVDVEVKAQSTKAADAVRRQLLVEAEGVPNQYNIPVLIDLTDSKKTFSKTIDLTLPDNVVKGSELVRISAVGDLMGPTIAKLDSLLQMPYGCGEQNMVNLAPDVYVTDYLTSVNQLNGDVKSKAINFMENGYQRELTYKHSDGSFSVFGNSDKSGSMWLTAFVARVFHQAKRHIFVDDNIIREAIWWMIQQQNTDGSFPETGYIYDKNIQGQAGSGVGLSLFVLISLLENRKDQPDTHLLSHVDEAIQKALAYAEQEVAKLDDLYVLAMASYAFQLAGSNMTQAVLDKLEAESNQKDGTVYWHQQEPPKVSTDPWHRPNPAKAVDIEMTAYVLLTYTKRGDLVAGKSIMQWITKQRNANGGFISTQDTVVALNALSEYAKQTYSNKLKVHITTQLDDETTYTFDVDKTNSLVLQSRENTTVPTQVVITATGSGMALVQASVNFHVLSEIEAKTFDLTIRLKKETIHHLVLETCTRWLGNSPNSGMAVQEFGIPSGFDADLESITKLDIVKRVETQNKKVILYFDKIGTTPVCLNLRVRRVDFVAKSQPAAVRVYDYYEPRNQVTVFYQSNLLKDSTICDVCPECENCDQVTGNFQMLQKAWDVCKAFLSWCSEIMFDIIHFL